MNTKQFYINGQWVNMDLVMTQNNVRNMCMHLVESMVLHLKEVSQRRKVLGCM